MLQLLSIYFGSGRNKVNRFLAISTMQGVHRSSPTNEYNMSLGYFYLLFLLQAPTILQLQA